MLVNSLIKRSDGWSGARSKKAKAEKTQKRILL